MAKTVKVAAKPAAKKVTKKVAPKTVKPTAKKVTKKVAPKTVKPTAKKTSTKTAKPVAKKTAPKTTPKGTTVEKEMVKISKLIEKAKKAGKTSVVVFTTKDSHHNGPSTGRVSIEDLKDVYRDLYHELICKYRSALKTNPIDLPKREIAWSINF
jgi:RNA polymerase primary sigma factor